MCFLYKFPNWANPRGLIFYLAFLVHFWIGWIPNRVIFSLGGVLFDCLLTGLFLEGVFVSCIGYLVVLSKLNNLDEWCIYFAHLSIWSPQEGSIHGSLWRRILFSGSVITTFFWNIFGKRQAAVSSWATCALLIFLENDKRLSLHEQRVR